jgi:hypothetical protein
LWKPYFIRIKVSQSVWIFVILPHFPICRLSPLDAVLSCGIGGIGGGLTSRERLNSSENYLLLGFLFAMQSQTVFLLVRQSVT